MEKIILSWGGGKDSMMALWELQKSGQYDVCRLLVTLSPDYDRVSLHGVRRVLLERQAQSLGLQVEKLYIPSNAADRQYEEGMRALLIESKRGGISSVAFGDIFLEDLRIYRERNLQQVGMKAVFPLWGRDTGELAHAFLGSGFAAVVTCVDARALDQGFVGRPFDEEFLSELPNSVDPCGENGEFHTFVFDGPIFKTPVSFARGDVVLRDDRFFFCDLVPLESPRADE